MKYLMISIAFALSLPFAPPAVAADLEIAQLEKMQEFLQVMQGYYQIVGDLHAIASDPEKSAILQLQKLEEIYKQRGDRAEAIQVMREVVENSKSSVVRNAASVMLSDALNETGQSSEAIKVLRDAIQTNTR